MAPFQREGAAVCVAWDGASGAILVSIDDSPFQATFPPDNTAAAALPGAAAGAGLFPAFSGDNGCVVEYSMRGELGLVPPSPDYIPCAQVQPAISQCLTISLA